MISELSFWYKEKCLLTGYLVWQKLESAKAFKCFYFYSNSAVSGSDLDEINAAFSLPAFAATWGFVATWIGVAEYWGDFCEPVKVYVSA